MAARTFGKVPSDLWDRDDLAFQAKGLYAYLLSNRHGNYLGCYACKDGYITADTGMTRGALAKAFEQLASAQLAERLDAGFVYIHGFIAENRPRSEAETAARLAAWRDLPTQCTRDRVAADMLRVYDNLTVEQRLELSATTAQAPQKDDESMIKAQCEHGTSTVLARCIHGTSTVPLESREKRVESNTLAATGSATASLIAAQALQEPPPAPPKPPKPPSPTADKPPAATTMTENATSTEFLNASYSHASVSKTPENALPIPLPRQAEKTKKNRPRNALVDAIISATGGDPLTTTKRAFQAAGVALAEIVHVCPDLTPQVIERAALAYRRMHRDWTLTPSALAKHWHTLGTATAPPKPPDPLAADGPEPSAAWRPVMIRIFDLNPDALDDKKWSDLPISYRLETLVALHKQN